MFASCREKLPPWESDVLKHPLRKQFAHIELTVLRSKDDHILIRLRANGDGFVHPLNMIQNDGSQTIADPALDDERIPKAEKLIVFQLLEPRKCGFAFFWLLSIGKGNVHTHSVGCS